MLLANYLVAQQLILYAEGRACLRMHPPPHPQKFQQFLTDALKNGFSIDGSSAGALGESLAKVAQTSKLPYAFDVMELQATTPMRPAVYIAAGDVEQSSWRHYALNIPYYTHFTSPIRRYADTLVHRLLEQTLLGRHACDNFYASQVEIANITEHCNEKKMASKKAQEQSDKVYFCIYLKEHPIESEAVVISTGEKSFTVYIPNYGYEGRVYLDKMPGDVQGTLNDSTGVLLLSQKSNSDGWPQKDTTVQLWTLLKVRLTAMNKCPIDVEISVISSVQ